MCQGGVAWMGGCQCACAGCVERCVPSSILPNGVTWLSDSATVLAAEAVCPPRAPSRGQKDKQQNRQLEGACRLHGQLSRAVKLCTACCGLMHHPQSPASAIFVSCYQLLFTDGGLHAPMRSKPKRACKL
jgi:hypothetical protein